MSTKAGELDEILESADLATNPWEHTGAEPRYRIDAELLQELVRRPLIAKASTQSGRLAKAIDAWVAHELRRAGFEPDDVWPRASQPRILPRDVRLLVEKLPDPLSGQVSDLLLKIPSVAPSDARFLGRAYVKQVDVAMARWDRGPELLVSTKAMTASFAKNVSNRFEEAYGDAGNLRARYPLAGVGFLFVQRATILRKKDRAAFERSVDMMRKLRDRGDGNGYTATCLLLLEWDDDHPEDSVRVLDHTTGPKDELSEGVPEDLGAPQFFASLVETVLEATPVSEHVRARERYTGVELATPEDD